MENEFHQVLLNVPTSTRNVMHRSVRELGARLAKGSMGPPPARGFRRSHDRAGMIHGSRRPRRFGRVYRCRVQRKRPSPYVQCM